MKNTKQILRYEISKQTLYTAPMQYSLVSITSYHMTRSVNNSKIFTFLSKSVSKEHRGGSKNSGKGVHMYKVWKVRFADFFLFFLNIPWKWNNLLSVRPNNFIFIWYSKIGGGKGRKGIRTILLNPLWIRHWNPDICTYHLLRLLCQ